MNLLYNSTIISVISLVIILINLLESSSYMYPLTIYAPEIIQRLLNDRAIDNEYLDRVKATLFIFVYIIIVFIFNLILGYLLGYFCGLFLIKHGHVIIAIANLVLFFINLYSFIILTEKNTYSSFISEDETINTILGMFFMLMERTIPQMIGAWWIIHTN